MLKLSKIQFISSMCQAEPSEDGNKPSSDKKRSSTFLKLAFEDRGLKENLDKK